MSLLLRNGLMSLSSTRGRLETLFIARRNDNHMRKIAGILTLLVSLVLAPVLLAQEGAEDGDLHATQPDRTKVTIEEVVTGLHYPLFVTHSNDGSGRLFILQQGGEILILKDGALLPTPFLDLSDTVSQDILTGYSERGLLGIAFHPDYAEN